MINLEGSLLIGKGRDRACFQHPENPKQCIKIALQAEKQSRRESIYFDYLKKSNSDLGMLSQHLGTVQTNFGTGHIYELSREENGEISPTLKEAIQTDLITLKQAKELVDNFEDYLIQQKICAYDLSPSNLIVSNADYQGKTYLKLIDGIGIANTFFVYFPIKIYTDRVLNTALKRLHRKIDKAFHYKELGTLPPKKQRKTKARRVIERIALPAAVLVFLFVILNLTNN